MRTLKDKLAAGLVSADAPMPEPAAQQKREEIVFLDGGDGNSDEDEEPDLFVIDER